MKKFLLSIVCLSSLLTASAGHLLVFVNDGDKKLEVSTADCRKFTVLKNLLDDDLQEDETESIPVHNCSSQTFEDLIEYCNSPARYPFLMDFNDYARVIAMVIAADHLGFQEIICQDPLVVSEYTYYLMQYVFSHFDNQQLQECFTRVSPAVIKETVKKMVENGGVKFLSDSTLKRVIKAVHYLNTCGDEYYHYSFDDVILHLLSSVVSIEIFKECAVEVEIDVIRDVIAKNGSKGIYAILIDSRQFFQDPLSILKIKFLKSNCGLGKEISIEELYKNKNLKSSLFGLQVIEGKVTLNLSERSITKLNGLAAVRGIETVQCLNLCENNITALEPSVFVALPNLEILNLRENLLATSKAFESVSFPKLRILNLERNPLPGSEREQLAEILKKVVPAGCQIRF